MKNVSVSKATLLGSIALILWIIEPLSVTELEGLPFFETLTIVFLSGFLVTAFRVTFKKKWKKILKQPLFLWLVGFACICGSDFAYFLAARCAPIAQVDLIDYLGPCLVVVFASLLPREKFFAHQIIGSLIGFIGIFIFVVGREGWGFHNISSGCVLGYILALYGTMIWGCYSAFSRHYSNAPVEMIGMYCGIGTIVSLIFHFVSETFVIPTFAETNFAIILGITGGGIAYQFWDYGVKFGNYKLLSSLTYFARVLAMMLLVLFEKEPLSVVLIVAVLLSSSGVFLSSVEKIYFRKILSFVFSRLKLSLYYVVTGKIFYPVKYPVIKIRNFLLPEQV